MAKPDLRKVAVLLLVALAGVHAVPARSSKEMGFAVSLARKGLWREAAHRFRLLIKKNPNNSRLWNNLAVAYEASELYDEAMAAYEKAASLGQKQDEFIANKEAFEAFYQEWKVTPTRSAEDGEEHGP